VTNRSVIWLRRDLRLADHPALAEACATGEALVLFVDDPAFGHAGGPRRALLHDCLAALRSATGGALVIRAGDPVAVVPAVAAEIEAATVFVSKDYGPYGRSRDADVAAALAGAGSRLRGVGSPYAVEPGAVTKADGNPYSVFTPFKRRWRSIGWAAPIDPPADPNWIAARSDPLPLRPDLQFELPDSAERAVAVRWHRFVADGVDGYGEQRDRPAVAGTSAMSPYLKYGVVHPRQLLADLEPGRAGHDTFADELAWRDFYADVLFRRPETAWENLDRRFDRIAVDTDARARARFDAWCAGQTGFPIVDAGIRQLLATGWMHNRVRMIVASFLVKDLHLPWQWGARFFMRHLLDGDLASNSHGWQWSAGCGTDAAPYFRVFNPTAQQQRYDPGGRYVAHWIPELGTSGYPEPIVDHAAERSEALARYAAIRVVHSGS
jgi:deoxyribodipyrimidine photo-lyase